MALATRGLHLPLPWVLLLAYLFGIWLFLYAALKLAEVCFPSCQAQLSAVALAAAWFTLPVAGTSLLLMDPYVTARTFSTPLSLLAIAFALRPPKPGNRRSIAAAASCLIGAAAFHILMAAYAAAFILALLIAKANTRRSRLIGLAALTAAAIAIATILQTHASPNTAAVRAASFSRYYWFLSQWQWYEWLGLAGPLVIFALLLRSSTPSIRTISRAAIYIGLISILISLLFAHESFSAYAVARLQPLRPFLLIYAAMAVVLGGLLGSTRHRLLRPTAPIAILAMACTFFVVQRQTYPASQHIELPSLAPRNPWSQAFVWAQTHTSTEALFAIDANYITTSGEDGQTFRATAQRSILPDFSKDGGEAAVRPSLTDTWFAGQQVQQNLSAISPAERYQRLHALGVTWLVLHASAKTNCVCPYANAVVKVCPLAPVSSPAE